MNNTDDSLRDLVANAPVVNKELAKTVVTIEMGITHPVKDELLAVRVSDWHRLKRLLKRVEDPADDAAVWWSLLFGVSATCFAAAVPLYFTAEIPKQITWYTVGAGVIFGIIGVFFLMRDHYRKVELKQNADDIETELANIDAGLRNSPETTV